MSPPPSEMWIQQCPPMACAKILRIHWPVVPTSHPERNGRVSVIVKPTSTPSGAARHVPCRKIKMDRLLSVHPAQCSLNQKY
ncbi:hypothetical protein C8Q77DRAFT_1131348 [Trametes polyzona]|nr:hypothetical protein C8Q77DRAFT_1131348 [Trametes polyzona]